MTSAPKKSAAIPEYEPTLKDVMVILRTMNTRMDGTDARLSHLERGQEKIQSKIDDMQEDLTSALAAFDEESIKILDHEKRIRRLEKAAA